MAKGLWFVLENTSCFTTMLIGITGDLVYVRLPGLSVLAVHKVETAHELLSKRSSINSGRSVGYMINDL